MYLIFVFIDKAIRSLLKTSQSSPIAITCLGSFIKTGIDVLIFPFKLKTYAIPLHVNSKRSLSSFKDISMKQLLDSRSFVKSIKGLELKRDLSTL